MRVLYCNPNTSQVQAFLIVAQYRILIPEVIEWGMGSFQDSFEKTTESVITLKSENYQALRFPAIFLRRLLQVSVPSVRDIKWT
jgi:hypothetical protein